MRKVLSLLLFTFSAFAFSQPTTNNGIAGQPCQGDNPRNWNNCVGTFTFPNGNTYTGQWQNGMRQGNGKIRIVAKGKSNANNIASEIPSTYVGQFANNKINGHGVWTTDNGDRFEGNFVDNILVSQGSAPSQQAPQQGEQNNSGNASALMNQGLQMLAPPGSGGLNCTTNMGGPSFGPTAGSMTCR